MFHTHTMQLGLFVVK